MNWMNRPGSSGGLPGSWQGIVCFKIHLFSFPLIHYHSPKVITRWISLCGKPSDAGEGKPPLQVCLLLKMWNCFGGRKGTIASEMLFPTEASFHRWTLCLIPLDDPSAASFSNKKNTYKIEENYGESQRWWICGVNLGGGGGERIVFTTFTRRHLQFMFTVTLNSCT